MSCNYADGLSPYENKGVLGAEEKFDSKEEVAEKVAQLASWICESNHVVVHTGAGISTSAGIPDFRGPKGVWTLEAKGEKPDVNISFNEASPTKTHMALVKLIQVGEMSVWRHISSDSTIVNGYSTFFGFIGFGFCL